MLSDIKISSVEALKKAAQYFHDKDIGIVVITGVSFPFLDKNKLAVFVSDKKKQTEFDFNRKARQCSYQWDWRSVCIDISWQISSYKRRIRCSKKAVLLTEEAVKNSKTLMS